MYIFEVIHKVLKAHRLKKQQEPNDYQNEETYEKCEHIFVPVDSTGETLACNKCGLVVKKHKFPKIGFKK